MKRILTAFALVVGTLVAANAGSPATAEHADAPSGPEREVARRLGNGHDNTCVILDNGNVRCWGSLYGIGVPGTGRVGDDETPDSIRPADVGDGRTVHEVDGGQLFTCVLLDDGNVRCWGNPSAGVIGVPGAPGGLGYSIEPTTIGPIDLGGTATEIAAGNFHACAILADDSVRCWGDGSQGALGYGNENDIGDDETPASAGAVDLGPGRTATAITAGRYHTCAILDDASVRCWGLGGNDVVYGDDEPASAAPVLSLGGDDAVAISAGKRSTCALTDVGDVWCWGSGDTARYSLGDGVTSWVPRKMDLGTMVPSSITVGFDHACIVFDDGQLYCWGDGGDGRLGYGDTETIGDGSPGNEEDPLSGGPVDVGAGRTVLTASAGDNTTCAFLDNETVRCWGAGGFIGLGTNETVGDDEEPGTVPVVNYTGSAAFTPLSPARIADTRLDKDAPVGSPKGILSPGDTIDVQVAGEGGVPDSGVYAVVLNVAMADPTGFGFVTAWPKGSSLPTAANLNVQDGNASNSVIVPLGDDGQVSLFSSGGGHLVVDVFGYFEQTGSSSSGRLIGVDPGRIFDTRPGSPEAGPELKVGAGETFTVDVTGTNGVPEVGVSAVVMNITAVRADGPGFVTVHPGDEPRNETANINLSLRTLTRPNTVIMPVADDGTIDIFTSTAAFLVGDVFGYFTDDTAEDTDDGLFVPVFPTRLLDSRELGPPVPADGTIDFQVTGNVGIPPTGNAVVFNLAGVTGQLGFITAYPNEITRPDTANLNVPGPETNISNLAIVPLSEPSGRITLYSESGAHLVADTSGYFL